MNGTEATKYIRRLETEGELVAHVPIIAITGEFYLFSEEHSANIAAANARMEQVAIARDSGMVGCYLWIEKRHQANLDRTTSSPNLSAYPNYLRKLRLSLARRLDASFKLAVGGRGPWGGLY